ncbi:MAG: hypothetical protein C1943_11380 [Halochromatium sp.]|nr:hypothetical protein [Halochromatium sp.]
MEPQVDIIIPVYRGAEETRRCIESVLSHPQRTPYALIIVDDASPDPLITEYLDELAADGRIALHRNPVNLGFVRSANLGMRLHPQRDLVLLNSDTEVANDWLDRLRACARAGGDQVATLTPFSNNATICSYPRIVVDNPLPAGLSVAELDALFRLHNRGKSLELLTGVGFCLYMTRHALEALGGFDEQAFGSGYGEEVDYCMRARRAGWRNLLCCDCFVFHQGGVSFQSESEPTKLAAQAIIDQRYPEFPGLVADFINVDPPRPYRRAIDLARLLDTARPRLLFIKHAWGGGVERHVMDLAAALADSADVLLFQPEGANSASLRWLRDDADLVLYQPLEATPEHWLSLLRKLGLSRVHYHQVHGFPEWILDLASALRLDYDVTLHDYTSICPQHHLITASGAYCGEPPVDVCTACIAERPPQWPLGIEAWHNRFGAWLSQAARVIAPSQDVAVRIGRYFPGLPFKVWPHLEPVRDPFPLPGRSLARRRVLLIGTISSVKGLRLLSEVAQQAARQRLALDFRVVGGIRAPVPQWPEANLSLTGEYREADLPTLLEQERPDAFLFLSPVPETYSYTLSLAMRTGLPIVALATGAFVERLREYPSAVLLPADVSVETLLETLCAQPAAYTLAASPALLPLAGQQDSERYLERYLEPVVPSRPLKLAPIDQRCFYPASKTAQPSSLLSLYEYGVLCGLTEAREQLAREVSVLSALQCECELGCQDSALSNRERQDTDLNGTLAAVQKVNREHVAHLERKVSTFEHRIAELEGSTFWRLTAPMRWSVQRSRLLIARANTLRRELPRLLRRAREVHATDGIAGLRRALWRHRARLLRRSAPIPVARPAPHQLEAVIGPLALPTSDSPLVSILIPTFGQPLLSFTCLKSLVTDPPAAPFEVLLIDDCAPEPAEVALAEVEGLRILRNPQNLGFLNSCNAAAEQARGRYLLLLNNDTIVLPGAIDALLKTFETQPKVGAVGAKLLFADGRLQEAGGIVWRDGSAWNWGRYEDPNDPRFQYLREVDYCSAACLLLPTGLFHELGGFDPRYAPAYYEDTDLCLSLRDRGLRVLYQPKAEVVHFEGASHGTDEQQGLKAYQVRNQQQFRDKWAVRLSRHRNNGVCPAREANRVSGQRILWVEACMLTPDQDSGSLRTWRLLEILTRLGHQVSFIADNLESSQPYTQDLQALGIEVRHAPYTRSVAELLRQEGADYDLIVLCRHYIAIQYVDLVRQVAPQAQLWFDTIDLHYLRLRRQLALEPSEATRQLAERAYCEELSIAARVDMTLVVSQVEQEALRLELPQCRVEVLGNVHDAMPSGPGFDQRTGVLFVGGFQHPPNVDAVEYLAREIWPLFRQQHPDARAQIIGSRMPESLRRLGEAAGLEMLGYIEDLTPYLRGCRISIAPLRYGAGVKGKVNQAMSYGLPVIATTTAVEGMEVHSGEEVLIADGPAAFAKAMSSLYKDAALWQQLAIASQRWIECHLSTTATTGALESLLSGAAATKPACRTHAIQH